MNHRTFRPLDAEDDPADAAARKSPVETWLERFTWMREAPQSLARRIPTSVFALGQVDCPMRRWPPPDGPE